MAVVVKLDLEAVMCREQHGERYFEFNDLITVGIDINRRYWCLLYDCSCDYSCSALFTHNHVTGHDLRSPLGSSGDRGRGPVVISRLVEGLSAKGVSLDDVVQK